MDQFLIEFDMGYRLDSVYILFTSDGVWSLSAGLGSIHLVCCQNSHDMDIYKNDIEDL
jgi:hypothetical protein